MGILQDQGEYNAIVNKIQEIIDNEEEINARIYTFPTSSIKENDVKINYFNYISSLKNEECNKALQRIVPLINLVEINKIVDNTEAISDIRKEFYRKILKERYNKILKYSINKLE